MIYAELYLARIFQ